MFRARLPRLALVLCFLLTAGAVPDASAQFGKLKKAITGKAAEKAVEEGTGSACFPNRPPTPVTTVELTADQMMKVNAGLQAEAEAAQTAYQKQEEEQKRYDTEQKAYEKDMAAYNKANEKYQSCADKVQAAENAEAEKLNKKQEAASKAAEGAIDEDKLMAMAEKAQAAAERVSRGQGTAEDRATLAEYQQMMGGVTAAMLLDQLSPRFAEAQVVKPEDPRVKVQYVEYQSPKGYGKMRGYLAQPARAEGKLPGILVIHENRGLNPHIEDVTRRLALENFVAFAPDALFPLGGYPGSEDKARELFPKLDQARTREDFIAATNYLRTRSDCTGRIGAVGFCYGGSMVGFLATRVPELAAAVPFYGGQPSAEDTKNIKAAMLIHYAGTDERINAGWPAWEAALKANTIQYEGHIYPGTQHGFNNDTTPRYDEAAAAEAWKRLLELFERRLRTG